jgi:hypothetical protein
MSVAWEAAEPCSARTIAGRFGKTFQGFHVGRVGSGRALLGPDHFNPFSGLGNW